MLAAAILHLGAYVPSFPKDVPQYASDIFQRKGVCASSAYGRTYALFSNLR